MANDNQITPMMTVGEVSRFLSLHVNTVDDSEESKEVQEEPTVEPIINGPFRVKNLKDFRNSKEEAIEVKPVVSLCRCGKSNSSPFCDGMHLKIDFRSDKSVK